MRLNAGVRLLDDPGDLGRREIAVPVVDRLELVAIERDHRLTDKTQRATQQNELAACRAMCRPVVAAEVGDSLEVAGEPTLSATLTRHCAVHPARAVGSTGHGSNSRKGKSCASSRDGRPGAPY